MLFYPWIQDPDPGREKKYGSEMNIPDHFSEKRVKNNYIL
jgi:hypothetical protein